MSHKFLTYQEIVNTYSTYSSVYFSGDPVHIYEKYSDLLFTNYGEYNLQVFNYVPLAHWTIDGEKSEESMFGELKYASIYSSIPGNPATNPKITERPIIYSKNLQSVFMDQNSYIEVDSTKFTYKIGKTVYKEKPFTACFWYQNINSVTSSSPIFKMGDSINVYAKESTIELNFLGQRFVYHPETYKKVFFISIRYDGFTASFNINGTDIISQSSISESFPGSCYLKFMCPTNGKQQISHVSIFDYCLSNSQIKKLYSIGSKRSAAADRVKLMLKAARINSIQLPSENINYFSPEESNMDMRNVYGNSNGVFLVKKDLAQIIGSPTFGSGGYSFSSGDAVVAYMSQSDIYPDNLSITVNCTASMASKTGVPLFISSSYPIYFKIEDSKLYANSGSTGDILIDSISSQTSFTVQFIENQIWAKLSGGTAVNTGISVPSNISALVVGNNSTLSSPYSGIINRLNVNYTDAPLQIGIYNLDLSTSYSSDRIKPTQDGVAVVSCPTSPLMKTSYLKFKSSGKTSVVYYPNSSTFTDVYSGSGGTEILPYSPVLNSAQDSIIYFTIRVLDDIVSTTNIDFPDPSVKEFVYSEFVSNKVISEDRNIYIESSDINAVIGLDGTDNLSKSFDYGIKILTNNNIVINGESGGYQSGVNYFNSVKIASFKLNATTMPATTSPVEIFKAGSYSVYLTKVDSQSYKLSTSSGCHLTVNTTEYGAEVLSDTLYKDDTNLIVLEFSGTPDANPYFSNCNNYIISDIWFSPLDPVTNYQTLSMIYSSDYTPNVKTIIDIDDFLLTNNIFDTNPAPIIKTFVPTIYKTS